MIKVAYILTPVEFGGAEKVNLTFLRAVDRTRFEICPILLVRPWEDRNPFIEQLGEKKYSIHKIPVAIKPRSEGRDYFRILRCIRNLYRILSKDSFHLIHTHGYFADIIGMPVSKLLNIPHVSTCHGFISNDRNLKIYNTLDRFSLRFCRRVIAVSEGVRDDLVGSRVRESKIIVIQNAVQNSNTPESVSENRLNKRKMLGIKENGYVAGYVGRLSDEKGIQYLIEAGVILKQKSELFNILIIGDGPKRKELENLAREKGLEKEIIFAGFQNDVEKWLPALDVFVLPSLTEGTPMALLEAMSTGVPVIATRVGGVPQVVEDGSNGVLLDPADSKRLAEEIMALVHDPALSKQMAGRAIETIENEYNVQQWCRKIEAQYDFALDRKYIKDVSLNHA
jgi:glycosyltransferase involved in cell wall biosynthesis